MNSNQGELKLKFEEKRVEGFEDWLSRIDLINDPSFVKLTIFIKKLDSLINFIKNNRRAWCLIVDKLRFANLTEKEAVERLGWRLYNQ
ncbi:MAG: hypothetical protein ACTSRZ_19955 [Promethearchaeota archaeon]